MKLSFKSRKLKNSIARITSKAKNLSLDLDTLLVYGVSKEEGVIVTGREIGKNLGEYFYFSGKKIAYNPYRVNIGSIGLTNDDFSGLMSPAYIIFEVDETIYPEFLLLYLKSNIGIRLIKWYGDRGGVRSSLGISDLGNIDFPDISYNEQKSIYNNFEKKKIKIEALLNELNKQQEYIDALRQSSLKDALEGRLTQDWREQNPHINNSKNLLIEIKAEKEQIIKEKKIKRPKESGIIKSDEFKESFPIEWVLAKVVDLCFVTKLAGFEYSKHFDLQDEGDIPVIRAQNVKPNRIDESNLKYIDLQTSKLLDRCSLVKPSILMTFIGAGIGDTAIFNKDTRWHLAPNVAKLEPFNDFGLKININYLQYYLMSQIGRSQIFKHVKSTAQPNISMGTIRDIIVILPSIEEQNQIVLKINQIMANLDNVSLETNRSKEKAIQLLQTTLGELLGEENVYQEPIATEHNLPYSREKKYDNKTTLMELVELLKKYGKLHAEDLWKMSKHFDVKNLSESIDKFYADLKEKIELDKTIKEVDNTKGYLELT